MTVVVIQPYVPAYRVPFFSLLASRLAEVDGKLIVLHGRARGHMALRGDSAAGAWAHEVTTFHVGAGRRQVRYRHVWRFTRTADVIVDELASTSLDSLYFALRRDRRLVLWGHGGQYIFPALPLDARIEAWLARRASACFVYTDGGKQTLVSGYGLDSHRVTVLRNSTDTSRLLAALAQVTPSKIEAFKTAHAMTGDGPRALFVGGLDAAKRVDFLLTASRLMEAICPGFQLLIGGVGADEPAVIAAHTEGHVRYLGKVGPEEIAVAASVCSAVWMPGVAGLVAVDALAVGLPLFTTKGQAHGPEIEYLTEGSSLHTTPDDPAQFVAAFNSWLERSRTHPPAIRPEGVPSIEEMVSNFLIGLEGVLAR